LDTEQTRRVDLYLGGIILPLAAHVTGWSRRDEPGGEWDAAGGRATGGSPPSLVGGGQVAAVVRLWPSGVLHM